MSTRQSHLYLHLRAGLKRLKVRPLSTASAATATGGSSTCNSKGEGEGEGEGEPKGQVPFFRFLSGIAAGSTLVGLCTALCFSPQQHPSSLLFASTADWNDASKKNAGTGDDDNNAHEHSMLGDEMEQERKKPKFLFRDSYRRRVFFKYEKRIRLRSPPEKVFEYFASYCSPEGEVFMTPADLMRAVVPVFPPSESNVVREGYLRGEKHPGQLHCADSAFFMLFDTNSDGLISFPEEIEQEEFKKVMALMRSYNRQGASHRDGKRNGLKVGSPVENGGLLEYFFGKDGTKCLQHEKFVQFLKDLHEEILRLEFVHYDRKLQRTMSAKDFALSLVASADATQINRFLDRVDELEDDPHLRKTRITWEEFKAFAELRKRVQPLALAIFSYGKVNGLLTKKDFQRAASHVCGISLTDNVVDVIFHVFDANRDGNLSADEFFAVLQRRERDVFNPTDIGFAGLISCCWNCARTCSFGGTIQ
ncbi:hypothetical protein ACLOJK_027588 [Asimina triloba]